MTFKTLALTGALIVPGFLAACADGGKAPAAATTAPAANEPANGVMGTKDTTPEQRRWLSGTHTPPAGR